MKLKLLLLLAFFLGFILNAAYAKPFLPGDDVVLLKLEDGWGQSERDSVRKLKMALKTDPSNIQIAIELAKIYVHLASIKTDPRYYGLAEATIKPWWNSNNNHQLMILKARILQFDHDFSKALEVLNNILKDRFNLHAILMRANILQVIGEYKAAKKDCASLVLKSTPLVSATCLFSVNGFTNSSEKAKTLIIQLKNLIDQSVDESMEVKLWSYGLIAESASLNHEWQLAENLIKNGLSLKKDDIYLLSLYADLLLKQGRFQACLDLLNSQLNHTSLFVRYLAAKNKLYILKAPSEKQKYLELRIREDDLRRDERHLREYAYYQLYVKKDYQLALKNALTNWENQKEMSDALILYQAAERTDSVEVLEMLNAWSDSQQIKIKFSNESLNV